MSDAPWDTARRLAHAAPQSLPTVTLPLAEAGDHSLAAPLVAAAPLPAFDNSAMDGYAVAGPGPWRVVGRLLAGDGEPGALHPGEATEIATGAPVPKGTLAVLPYERATRSGRTVANGNPVHGADGDLVAVAEGGTVEAGACVRTVGEDVAAGAQLAPAGAVVTPLLLGLAASVGLDALAVHVRPRVEVLVTGDEIVSEGLPGAGRVRDALGPMLPGLVRWLGGEFVRTVRVPDHPEDALARALREPTARESDVVVVCGSSSAGPADRLRAVLAAHGARVVVDGVACRPGRPQALAQLADGRWVVGAPGNPFAALVAVLTLLGPLLAGLGGRPLPVLPVAPLCGDPRPRPGRTRLVPVGWAGGGVRPLDGRWHGSVRLPAAANALAAVPAGWAGEPVPLVLLP